MSPSFTISLRKIPENQGELLNKSRGGSRRHKGRTLREEREIAKKSHRATDALKAGIKKSNRVETLNPRKKNKKGRGAKKME